jgi:hypothetical protein
MLLPVAQMAASCPAAVVIDVGISVAARIADLMSCPCLLVNQRATNHLTMVAWDAVLRTLVALCV